MTHTSSPAPPEIRVTTRRRAVPPSATLPVYQAVAHRFGREHVYLLESTAGPDRDRKYQFVGFNDLLSLSVSDGTVQVEGAPALREAVLRRITPLLDDNNGTLRLPRLPDLWTLLREVHALFDAEGSAVRFRFGFLGYFGYDTIRYVEDLPHLIDGRPDLPDVHLVLYQGSVVTDLDSGESELLLHESDHWAALDEDEIATLLARAETDHPEPVPGPVPPTDTSFDTEAADYRLNVERALKHIAVGDVYQVQLGHELSMRSTADPLEVYQRMRTGNASPYMYLASVWGQSIVGASPELFVRVEDGTVTMRPIAGTVPRTGDDEAAGARLLADEKEIAEHIMLVDLCRNDIGRICQADSLRVPDELVVERYSHVLHLVSTVQGEAEPDRDTYDIISALFPAGTMTGTPKIRAMEIIEEIEDTRRGLYAGAMGLIDVGGYTNLALCIRTLFHHDGVYRTRASAGVVADSVPDREWTETLAKMNAAYWAVTGKELL
ncbi:anthranilate synthase component I family protein [Streptomyces sp. H34-S5]|nr:MULTISPECIES: anthranilate synthase component I family protein [unclassified Streptomyces]MCY0942924.1 anthranilate synthase component I family protein [Streptomyces sp. H34-AA3]MCZ4083116.1 anthranilate synthase component I family protein [Streptomyces sp. H34-S5]